MPPDKFFLEGELGVHLGPASPFHFERKCVWSPDSPQVGREAEARSWGGGSCTVGSSLKCQEGVKVKSKRQEPRLTTWNLEAHGKEQPWIRVFFF